METHWGALLGLLCVQLCWVSGLTVEQSPSSLSFQEGTNSTLRCSFSTTVTSVQWFRQNPGNSLISLFFMTSGKKENGRLSSTMSSKERYSTLHISDFQLEDSATYLCAVFGVGSYQLSFGKGTKLLVTPNIKNPDPAVYQLRSSKPSTTSICLFTDFSSQTNLSQVVRPIGVGSQNTVLDMRAMDSKSNGVLRWSNSSDFGCNIAVNETFYSSSDYSCNAMLVEKSFETDMNLNFQNLSVVGLRVLLLKVVGFNLLMTLRLWSS